MQLNFSELIPRLPTGSVLAFLEVPTEQEGNYFYTPCLIEGCEGKIAFCSRGEKQNLGYCLKEKRGMNILQFACKRMEKPIREAAEIIAGAVLHIKTTDNNKPLKLALELSYHPSMTWCHPDLTKDLEIGYCKKGILAGHIAFAVHDSLQEDGIAPKVGYVGKNVKDGKWKFPKNLDPATLLYNFHRCQGYNAFGNGEIFVTRELETAVKFWGYGLPVVATFGANILTGNQLELLREFQRITFLKEDTAFMENICYQSICSFGNFWRVKTLPTREEEILSLL